MIFFLCYFLAVTLTVFLVLPCPFAPIHHNKFLTCENTPGDTILLSIQFYSTLFCSLHLLGCPEDLLYSVISV